MNKSEFIRAYADTLGVTIKEAENNFSAFVETLTAVDVVNVTALTLAIGIEIVMV